MSAGDLPEPQAGEAGAASNSFMALANLDQAAIDAFPQAVYLCAGDGRVVRFNDKAAELWGRTPRPGDPEERFCGSHRLYLTDGTYVPHDQCPMAVALHTGESFHGQEIVVERPDGERRTILVNIAAIKDQEGRVNGAINCFQDISERRRAEEGQRHLVQELRHRVKNTLATVHSMATFTAGDATSVQDFTSRFEARLVALSHAQVLLSECEENGYSLRDLLAQQLQPFGVGEGPRVQLSGPDVDLNPTVATALCMVFHELMTNAAKYGSLSVDGGQIAIAWDVRSDAAGERALALEWTESGGPAIEPPKRSGFGTKLIRRIIAGLHGNADLRFQPIGLQLQVTIPIGK